MFKHKQKGDILILLLIALAVVLFFLWSSNKGSVPQTTDNSNPNGTQNTNSTLSNTGYVPPPGMSIGTINYGQALVKYANARIQIDQNCQASPSNMTFKNDTYIMIDNRASITRIVSVGPAADSGFNVPAYGFKIVRLLSATVPVTWGVDCGTSKNVATILIQ